MASAERTADLRNYAVVTAAYWSDTITDGAIRVLVLFYFYERGYSPFAVASLFWLASDPSGWTCDTDRGALDAGIRAGVVAGGGVRDGRPGALGDREGPH